MSNIFSCPVSSKKKKKKIRNYFLLPIFLIIRLKFWPLKV